MGSSTEHRATNAKAPAAAAGAPAPPSPASAARLPPQPACLPSPPASPNTTLVASSRVFSYTTASATENTTNREVICGPGEQRAASGGPVGSAAAAATSKPLDSHTKAGSWQPLGHVRQWQSSATAWAGSQVPLLGRDSIQSGKPSTVTMCHPTHEDSD